MISQNGVTTRVDEPDEDVAAHVDVMPAWSALLMFS